MKYKKRGQQAISFRFLVSMFLLIALVLIFFIVLWQKVGNVPKP